MKPEIVSLIDGIDVTLNAGGMNTINIVLAFVMYGVALGIKPGMFVEVFKKPKSVLVGACSQIILLPLFTFLLALALGSSISWTMAMGMILVASCPGGNISNFISSLSKANVELSVSLTAISTALAILTTPFNFWFYGNLYMDLSNIAGEVPQLAIPLWDVFKTIFILLGIAENRREAQEAHADIQHTLLHRDDSPVVHGQHRRIPEVHQIHLPDRSDT